MNFVFISPQFPPVFWQFCNRLQRNGVTVLGIGDAPYDGLAPELKSSLTEYYYTPNLADYSQVFRAVAFFSYKYGKIDWLESNNEFWLAQDARLRDDFHIVTGASTAQMAVWQSKAGMKPLYAMGSIPTARQIKASTLDDAKQFAAQVGYPLFAKPEVGMGSLGARKIADEAALAAFFADRPKGSYVIEEFVSGRICSYDAIFDSHANPLFENMEEFPRSMARVAEEKLDMAYTCLPAIDPRLQKLGRAAGKSFGIRSRFTHMEFFRLDKAKEGLGDAGDYVGLEVNLRPPGSNTPNMMNYAHSCDVYQIWADMVTKDATDVTQGEQFFCVYASQRDCRRYVHSDADIRRTYGERLVEADRISPALADDMGDMAYTAKLRTDEERREFIRYVQERTPDDAARPEDLAL